MENKNLVAALQYLKKGYSVLPLNPSENDDIGKKPFIPWAEFQKRKPTEDEVTSWWSKWPSAMVGLICGQISGFMVMDTDSQEQDEDLQSYLPDGLVIPIARTPGGGKHYYFKYSDGIRNSNGTSGYTFHVRGEGGYVVAPPSERIKKGKYVWIGELDLKHILLPEAPMQLIRILLKEGFKGGVLGGGENQPEPQTTTLTTTDHSFFEYGKRDNSLFHTANLMTKAGGEPNFICEVLERLILSWGENPDKRWIDAKIKSALERLERKERNISSEVHDFVLTTTGHFLTTEVHNCLQVTTRNDKKAVVMALKRLCDQKVIQKYGDKNGMFIKIETDFELIDWENADDSILPLQFPFELERLVSIMPKNILVIAGIPNAGKTAFLLNFARMNMDKWPILYFSSEMDGAELKARLKKFEGPIKQWRKVGFYRKEEDFANALNSDGVNIIDFLEITDKFYLIAERLREYHKRLNRGVLFVAIQKDPQKEYGRGGGLGLEKPRLYLTMDRGKLKILKGKTWASEQNPEGMQIEFKLIQGAKFITQDGWKSPEKREHHQNKRFGDD